MGVKPSNFINEHQRCYDNKKWKEKNIKKTEVEEGKIKTRKLKEIRGKRKKE